MSDFEFYVKKAGDFHGHICAGILLGTKMTLVAMQELGLSPSVKNKNLLVYAEIDRCMTDAVQAISGCSLGHRSLKFIDYGKFAATFVNQDTGRGLRVTVKESFDSKKSVDVLTRVIDQMTPEEMLILQEVELNILPFDLPGKPSHKTYCVICGERVMDGREVHKDGKDYCRGCAGGQYYTEKLMNSRVMR